MVRLTRAERYEADGLPAPLPELLGAEHLLDYLWAAGPSMETGMGAVPLTFMEILAWQQASGIDLNPWESVTLRRLSAAYASETQRSSQSTCAPPFQELSRNPNVDSKLDSFLD